MKSIINRFQSEIGSADSLFTLFAFGLTALWLIGSTLILLNLISQ